MNTQSEPKIKAILTGATGMVGEGVLLECLKSNRVEQVLVITRRHSGWGHPKLKEIIHSNFYDLSPIEDQLRGYNACYFCAGVSSVGKKESTFYHLTYDLTMHVATTLSRLNPEMTFCYVSGVGTDSTEKGKVMWARVKGKTENDLMKLSFRSVYNFRPGFLEPTKGMKHAHPFYTYVGWLIPLFRKLTPAYLCSLADVGRAMIRVSTHGYHQPIIEVADIVALAKKEA